MQINSSPQRALTQPSPSIKEDETCAARMTYDSLNELGITDHRALAIIVPGEMLTSNCRKDNAALGSMIAKSGHAINVGNHHQAAMPCGPLFKEGKSAINLSNLGKVCLNLAPGHLFMLGLLAVPKIIYVRPVGSSENTSNNADNPNINNLT